MERPPRPGVRRGNWYDPETKEYLQPDLGHGEPYGPHWTIIIPVVKMDTRFFGQYDETKNFRMGGSLLWLKKTIRNYKGRRFDGVKLQKKEYRMPSGTWDHDHCAVRAAVSLYGACCGGCRCTYYVTGSAAISIERQEM